MSARGELLYVGRSLDVTRRIGQFLGAVFGGWWLHSGGFRIFKWRQSGKLTLPLSDLNFEVWVGTAAYGAEAGVIAQTGPPVNATVAAAELSQIGLDPVLLEALFAPHTPESSRTEHLGDVLDAVVRSVGRQPYPSETTAWTGDGWRGVGRRVGRQWRNTLYAGFLVEAGGVRVGLWAYEGNDLWFSRQTAEYVAGDAASLLDVVDGWRRSWYGS